jgi:FHS family glucose/mannose:H+ symporter-like MFS transporter
MTNEHISNSKPLPARGTVSNLVLSFGFSLTGAGTVMLGVLLPVLSQRWALTDSTAGLLLLLQFLGSALGAVLTGLHRVRSLIFGYGLLVLSLGAITLASSGAPFAAFFFYGLGLGLVMTATSLLITDRSGDESAAKLEGLNFIWSVGATAGPMLFLPFLRKTDLRVLFLVLLALFMLQLAWVVFAERQEPRRAQKAEPLAAAPAASGIFLSMVILAVCAVGIEAAMSGWLTTYSHRAGLHSLAGAALATSLFWLGEMISRLAFSTRLLAKMGRRATLRATIWGVLASVAALIAAPYPSAILAVAVIAGVCIGPLYPLLLSFMLEHSSRGWIFAVGGVGAAVFPWLTGMLSSHFHSLRLGLTAPCGAGLIMVALLQSAAVRRGNAAEQTAPVNS